MESCNFSSTVKTHKLVIKYFADHIQRVNTKISVDWWIRIESHSFLPDEFLDIFFSEHWFLKIKIERSGTYRFLVDIMKRCHVWMAQRLINCKAS
ncbi:mitogen-activated protein kinase protein MMK2 [Trifolium repens]|nr:mitogen-activated protein kinase protein MMK2 [Trifolium repens]